MNLYDFSQINNNEMGVYIQRAQEPELYRDTYNEAQRLIRISEQVRLSAEKVEEPEQQEPVARTSSGPKRFNSRLRNKDQGVHQEGLSSNVPWSFCY